MPHFMKMHIQHKHGPAPYYPEGYPTFSDEMQEWCNEVLGYLPEIVWTADAKGVNFQTPADMVLFRINASSAPIKWREFPNEENKI